MTAPQAPASVRVDVWLWAVRVFKTRSAATAACRAGHEQVLEVVQLLTKRVGAPVAAKAYVDHSPPPPPALHAAVPRRDRRTGRPTKKDRREMDRLRGL